MSVIRESDFVGISNRFEIVPAAKYEVRWKMSLSTFLGWPNFIACFRHLSPMEPLNFANTCIRLCQAKAAAQLMLRDVTIRLAILSSVALDNGSAQVPALGVVRSTNSAVPPFFSTSPITSSFYLPFAALNAIADDANAPQIVELNYKSGPRIYNVTRTLESRCCRR